MRELAEKYREAAAEALQLGTDDVGIVIGTNLVIVSVSSGYTFTPQDRQNVREALAVAGFEGIVRFLP